MSHKARLINERCELKKRMADLERILELIKIGECDFTPDCDYELLSRQFYTMRLYSEILDSRCLIEIVRCDENDSDLGV